MKKGPWDISLETSNKQCPRIKIGTTLIWNREHDTINPHCKHFAMSL